MKNLMYLMLLAILFSCPNCSLGPITTSTKGFPIDRPTLGDCLTPEATSETQLKSKNSVAKKVAAINPQSKIPSSIVGIMMYEFKRFQAGKRPSNVMERNVFNVFNEMDDNTQKSLACSINNFDKLLNINKAKFIPKELITNRELSLPELKNLFKEEITARVETALLNSTDCDEERPGKLWELPVTFVDDVDVPHKNRPVIYMIDGLRTSAYLPRLSPSQYRPEELEHDCTIQQQNGQAVPNCEVKVGNCPGDIFRFGTNFSQQVCLKVQEFEKGASVVLEGMNFFNINGKVRLHAKGNFAIRKEVDAFVCGDINPTSEENTRDKLVFTIPDDLSPGVYQVSVLMPDLNTGDIISSHSTTNPVFVRILPNSNAVFQVATEKLTAEKETPPARFGSDEVGIDMVVLKVDKDLKISTGGEADVHQFKFGDVDSGNSRDMSRVLFKGNDAAISIAILGFEIDSDKAFEEQTQTFLKAAFDVAVELAAFFEIGAGDIGSFVSAHPYAVAISAAIIVAVVVIAAIWAPADLLIQDNISLSKVELAQLTNIGIPMPGKTENRSPDGIKVETIPVEKTISQYKEDRIYHSDGRYKIRFRYNAF